MAKLAVVPTGSTSDVPTTTPGASRRPILLSVRGRHETGKTTLLSLLIDTARDGYPIRIVDADTNNSTLAAWFPQAIIPSGVNDERRINVEAEFNWAMDHAGSPDQADLFADLGGDDAILPRLGAELGYADALAEAGVDPVLIYVVGPDARHLKPIDDMEGGRLFCPPRTIVALNAGLVPMDRSASVAYADVLGSSTLTKLKDRGARVVILPALDPDCMRKLKAAVLDWHETKVPDRPVPGFKWALTPDGRRALGVTDHLRVKAFVGRFVEGVRRPLQDWIPD
jgi:hypothetical protein